MSMDWKNINEEKPLFGERVIVWHPFYEQMIAYATRDGFVEMHLGVATDLYGVEFWMPLPKRPQGIRCQACGGKSS